MDDNRSKTFAVGKYKLTIPDPKDPGRHVPFESFTLREGIGDDQIAAFERMGPTASNAAVRDSQIADMFTAVNGEPVVAPFVGWRKWSLKARDFVVRAFNRMNDASTAELEDFEKAAFGG
jgi:hypothetical protein